ncbi:MAG TPA: SBBP repeat-containing protein [Bryobacteraceae bacterium]|jgi:hypothetical protein|nr:SBBP repeat-containing protein [Bryobacteraceae bacterium]
MRQLFLVTACAVAAAPAVLCSNIPLSFEPNTGQAPAGVHYLARAGSYTFYLAGSENVLTGRNRAPLRMKLKGANPSARVVGEVLQSSTSNYFIGNDPGRWRTAIPNYGRVRYADVYPGIDLVYYGHDEDLEYDWIVSPGADPQRIRLTFEGADRLRVDKQGDMVVKQGKMEYRHRKPSIYQEVAGKRVAVAGTWMVRGEEASFRLGSYDREQALVIDPVLMFSTYLGGSNLDYAYATAVDLHGNTYITGNTGSADFPVANALQSALHGVTDAFVTKINANGTARIYTTFLGGGGPDQGNGIAVDTQGNAYVTGDAGSFDFPTAGAIQSTWGGSGDAFVSKLSPSGSLVYSTYIGGSAIDSGRAIALDPAGNAYVTGVTFSANFPTVHPFQAAKGLQQDAFVAKINPAGTAWVYSTYLGGNQVDEGYGIAADAAGNAYITGYTASTDFPLQSPFQSSNLATVDAFVTKLNPAGSALVYSTYLGGSDQDYGTAIAVDSSGSAYVTGAVRSPDFPLVNPIQAKLGSHAVDDAFVAKFNPAGSALIYSTYLGGASEDEAYALAIDQTGDAYVTGRTNSSDFPLANAIQPTRFAFDMFVTELDPSGSVLLFSTFVGGNGSESGQGIAVDRLGNIHVAGQTTSADFPVVNALQSANGGGTASQDAAVLVLGSVPFPAGPFDFAGSGRSGALLYEPSNGQSYTALSNGDGTYRYVPNLIAPNYDILITGDFNGDGKADLIVYNSQTALASIGMGVGDGTFSFQPLLWSQGYDTVVTGDIDGDGKTDVALYNSTTGTLYTGISKGDGTFTYQYASVSPGFTAIRLADFTGDGKSDLLLYRADTGLAFSGVGDGAANFAFHPLSLAPGYSKLDIGDLDGDGKADVILYQPLNGTAATGISDGLGGFRFTPLLFSTGFTSVRLADYTGDGKADLTVYNSENAAAYFGTGNGDGTFDLQSMFWSPGYDWVVPEDANGDEKTDLVLYNSATGTAYTGISDGQGTFSYTYQSWGTGRVLASDRTADRAALPLPSALSIAKTHTGNFFQGQGGAIYILTVSNAPGASTGGLVTVTENLPAGLTLTSMSGTGWICPGTAANNCTRSDVLVPGASYPAIEVIVQVANSAPASLNNQASVSGGGSAAANTADLTTIGTNNPCNPKKTGIPSVSDVQQTMNESLGAVPAGTDVNRDGVVNVLDVGVVIKAALGSGCWAG